jgi:hypothetical protein
MVKAEQKERRDPEIIPLWIPMHYTSALLGNLLIFGVMIAAAVFMAVNREVYYLIVQEDKAVEWMTFWAFFAAAAVYAQASFRQYAGTSKIPWFLILISLFCLFVAMEEVSWGQRLLGYRPPAYFLENNFQQEFNVHNVIDDYLRNLTLRVVILGFGVIFPLVWIIPGVQRLLWKIALVPPPVVFSPAFLATYILFEEYPWKYAGEVAELMLGLGFLFSAMGISSFFKNPETLRRPFFTLKMAILVCVLASLTWIMSFVSNLRLQHQPELIEVARKEILAMGNDFRKAIREAKSPITHCKLHNRIFAHVEKYEINSLYEGYFWNLTTQGLPEERARFFIDPWNTAYWIWQVCDPGKKQVKIFIYSFGPNCRRDSVEWEIRGDDIGICIYQSGFQGRQKEKR